MNPDQVHSAVARCLTDPDFLLRAYSRSRSDGLGESTAEDIVAEIFGNAELERLKRFRGFITKVKHNSLRRRIPATLGLMGALGIELAFFCDFSSTYVTARREGPLKTSHHLDLLSSVLSDFLAAQPDGNVTPVAETFAHERLIFDLVSTPPTVIETEHVRWFGDLKLVSRTVDVIRICDRLGARDFDLSDIEMRMHILCYWRPSVEDYVSIFEVDALTAALLSALRVGSGPEEMEQVLRGAGLSQICGDGLRATALAAAQRGFVELRGGWLR